MKMLKLSSMLLGSAFLLSASAFAANTIKKSLHLYENVTVAGKQLVPGDYKVEWSGSGPDVEVNIMQGRDTVATAPARIVSRASVNEQDGYALDPGKSGNQSLAQVFFTGERFDLDFGVASKASASHVANSSGTN
jgi:hypothetical protein